MKTSRFLIMLLATLSIAAKTYAGQPNANFGFSPRVQAMAASHSILLREPASRESMALAYDNCHKYRAIEISGIVLLSVGVTTMITGGVITNVHDRNTVTGEGPVRHPVYGPGAGLFAFGTLMTASGIALTVAGAVKRHRYCGASSTYFAPVKKGLGLAYNF
jgi:hypothetical protein